MSKNNFEILTLNKKEISDFAFERNKLLQNSKSEWVLFIDSDEQVSDLLLAEVLEKVSNKKNDLNGYFIKRKNYFLGEYIGTDNILRLARREQGKWERRVHEVWKVKGNIGQLENFISHNTAKSLNEYISKIKYYASLHATANKAEGKRSSIIKIIFYPKLKFIQSVLTGRGIVFSILQAFHSFLAWSELWLDQRH